MADDDVVSRIMVQGELERLGHEAVIAADGEQAWERFRATDPNVVITDWMMPQVDGLELCRRIRAHTHGSYTYIILVTSLVERDNVLTGMEAGADDYLTKPLEPFDLETRLIAAARVTSLHADLARYRNELAVLACTDPLTKLRNRLALHDDLAALHARSQRYGRTYCLAMCDVDCFKAYNDTYGHQAGDEVLRTVAATLAAEIRQSDGAYRYGGEEFLLVLPDQSLTTAAATAERTRRAVENLGITHQTATHAGVVTISIGIAGYPADNTSKSEDVLAQADAALYQAKADGRNRVTVTPQGQLPATHEDEDWFPTDLDHELPDRGTR